MSVSLTPSLLAQPAAASTRLVAIERLKICADALDQLGSGEADALHDLRVSMRRLRTWLRNFRPYIDDTVRRKRLRRLHDLVRSTNEARDREVWLEWLAEQTDLPSRARSGARFLTERLTSECTDLNEDAVMRLGEALPRIIRKLRRDLAIYTVHVSGGRESTMATATADAVRDAMKRLRGCLDAIESEDDIAKIHKTRIAAKRLRYIVETLDARADAAQAAERLTAVQDQLGATHDMHLLVARLLEEIEAAAAAESRQRVVAALGLEGTDEDVRAPHGIIVGLTELARRAGQRARDEFKHFRGEWSASRLEEFEAQIDGIASALEAK